MTDFKSQGGSLTGREERYDGFEGEPKTVGGALGSHHHGTGATDSGTGTATGTGTGQKASLLDKLNPRKDADGDGRAGIGK